ncbi:MAG: DUF3301 domain-containing protein [Lysobacterales bacterium]
MDSLTPMLLVFLGCAGFFWFDIVRAREVATSASKRACMQCQVQFLDQTVRLTGMKLARNDSGNLGLRRHYRFEFSEAGADRHSGTVVIRSGLAREVVLEGTTTGTVVIPMAG